MKARRDDLIDLYLFRESLQKAEIPAAQGLSFIFQSLVRLKNDGKRKIAFCVFRALLSQNDLYRASLVTRMKFNRKPVVDY